MQGQRKFLAAALLLLLAAFLITAPVQAGASTPEDRAQQTTTNPPPRVETYGIGWGTLMLINAGLAQGKNRKGLNWFLISLLLGPLATFLLVAFFPKLPASTP